jgi:isoamylase
MQRIDTYPTHSHEGYRMRVGKAFPLGATLVPGGVNFSVFSGYARNCTLVLFRNEDTAPMVEIPFPPEFRIGNVFTMVVFDLNYEDLEYGYRMTGPFAPTIGHRFDTSKVLLDPYARSISGRETWANDDGAQQGEDYEYHGRLIFDDFDWQNDRLLELPIEDLVIYEMHVRGFTRHPNANVKHPGTFAGISEKIPYLKELGVNCVELMPVNEFDELEYVRHNPYNGERLVNYWGYSTVGFFAPKAGYAATGKYGMQADELKTLIKDLHKNGIEVILDVVFNHTSEGDERGKTVSFRGIDNKTYYMLTPDGRYLNFSGTGNTMNCNNPVVRNMVLDCLRYWVSEYHIDGFRFDLASILGRASDGTPLRNPPLIEAMAYDPILAHCKLIAEAWDAGGLYQVGSFPSYGRWAEWNGKYRDTLRRFIKGDGGMLSELATRLMGSPDLYGSRTPAASINFITCHDGFTMRDLVSYNGKHNLANAENNMDGTNDNHSWNCGIEGETDDEATNALRLRQIKNMVALLFVSQGVPMILMGDEVAHTKYGNNNTYCHDNALNWFDWSLLEQHQGLFNFFKQCIAFRAAHPVLRYRYHLTHRDFVNSGYADVTWHGTKAWYADWGEHIRTLAFMLDGAHAMGGNHRDDTIYVAINSHWESHVFEIPGLPDDQQWHVFANTSAEHDVWVPGTEPQLANQRYFMVGARSVVILVGR